MNWSKSPSLIEYSFLLIYLLFYGWYVFRLYRMSRRLGTKARALIIKLILRTFAFGLIWVAILGPSFGKTDLESRATSKDIFFVVDLSRSMDTRDVAPSRLERTKLMLAQLIEECKGNRMGLIAFSGHAELRVPLTHDDQALLSQVYQLSTNQMTASSTEVWSATDLVLKKFESSALTHSVAQVAVLVTDGEHFGSATPSFARQIRQAGIHFYLIGVGTPQGGPVLRNGMEQRSETGTTILTKRDDAFLKRKAQLLQASLHWLDSNNPDPVFSIVEKIQDIQLPTADLRKILIANDKYYYFLALALLLLFFDVLVTVPILKI